MATYPIGDWRHRGPPSGSGGSLPDLTSLIADDDLYQQALKIFQAQEAGRPEFERPEVERAPEKPTKGQNQSLRWQTIGEFLTALGQLAGGPGGTVGQVTQKVGLARENSQARMRANKASNREMDNQINIAEAAWINRQKREEQGRLQEFKQKNVADLIQRRRDVDDVGATAKAKLDAKIEEITALHGLPEAQAVRLQDLGGSIISVTSKTGKPMPDDRIRAALLAAQIPVTERNMGLMRGASEDGVAASEVLDKRHKERYGGKAASRENNAEYRSLSQRRLIGQSRVTTAEKKFNKEAKQLVILRDRMADLEDSFFMDYGINPETVDPDDPTFSGITGPKKDKGGRNRRTVAAAEYEQYKKFKKDIAAEIAKLRPYQEGYDKAVAELDEIDRRLSAFGGQEVETPLTPEQQTSQEVLNYLAFAARGGAAQEEGP